MKQKEKVEEKKGPKNAKPKNAKQENAKKLANTRKNAEEPKDANDKALKN